MPPSKQNISKSNIEKEIYKTFELFKKEKNITIADFLKKFDVSILGQGKYRKIKFSYESLIKLVLFQKLKGIKFHTKLTKYLRRNPKDKFRLGFSETPDRTQIGYFINHILDKETKENLDYASDTIERISEKFGILLGIKLFEPEEPKKQTKQRNQYLQINRKTKEVAKTFKKRFSPFIDMNLNHNTVYTKNQFLDLIIHMGQTKDFAENGSKTFKELRSMGCPDADTLLYHLKNYRNPKEIWKMYTTLFEIVWDMARKANIFDIRKRYDVAIDYTEWYFYGDKSAPMVMGKKPDRGTAKCYKFATINIVEPGKRFTLLAIPVGHFDRDKSILTKLLNYALERVKIRRVYVDRGFFNNGSINTLKKYSRLKFLMPCSQNSRIQKLLRIFPAPSIIKDYEMEGAVFNVVIVEDEDKSGKKVKYAFATNEEYDENDVNLADRLFDLYGKRWGVETSYRVKKHSYLPKTTSKNYLIRLFYFMFSVLLYNLWIMADILIWLALFGKVGEDHRVTSKLFGTILYTIDPDSGE